MHILGLANGSIDGNSTILLKAALHAAALSRPNTTTSWIHIPSIAYPPNAGPLASAPDVSLGTNSSNNTPTHSKPSSTPDDRAVLYDAIMAADALIFSTAVYSHQPAGALKSVLDTLLGPYTDAAFAGRVLAAQAADASAFAGVRVDARVLRPRVAGFLAVGGSTTPDQFTMVLPTLHLFAYGMHVKVVDQAVVMGCANPGAVVYAGDGKVMERAEEVGRRVASQLGRGFDEAEYLGPVVEGACPQCHLAKYDFFGGSEMKVGCVVCGNTGRFVVEGDRVRVQWDEDSDYCCISWRGKEKHLDDIFKNGSAEWKGLQGSKEKLQEWRDLDVGRVELPSEQQAKVVSTLAQMRL